MSNILLNCARKGEIREKEHDIHEALKLLLLLLLLLFNIIINQENWALENGLKNKKKIVKSEGEPRLKIVWLTKFI